LTSPTLGGQPRGVGEASERRGALGLVVLGAGVVDGVVEQRGQGHQRQGFRGNRGIAAVEGRDHLPEVRRRLPS
jgi:hypothetical protein